VIVTSAPHFYFSLFPTYPLLKAIRSSVNAQFGFWIRLQCLNTSSTRARTQLQCIVWITIAFGDIAWRGYGNIFASAELWQNAASFATSEAFVSENHLIRL
jgi:hypothetical protein